MYITLLEFRTTWTMEAIDTNIMIKNTMKFVYYNNWYYLTNSQISYKVIFQKYIDKPNFNCIRFFAQIKQVFKININSVSQ